MRRHQTVFVVALPTCGPVAAATVTLTADSQYQTIYGFGTGGNPAATSLPTVLPKLVDDLGTSVFREMADGQFWDLERTNDNADPNVMDRTKLNYAAVRGPIHLIRQYKARGVTRFYASVLSPPKWMKINIPRQDSIAFWCSGQCAGNLNPAMYEEFAELLVAYVRIIKDSCGVDLYGLSPQNEPAFAEPYGSCVYTAEQFRDLIKVVGARFQREGLATRIIAPEHMADADWASGPWFTTMFADTQCRRYVGIGAVHGYHMDGITASSPDAQHWTRLFRACKQAGKPLWMDETSGFNQDWPGALRLAKAMYTALKFGQISLWSYNGSAGSTLDGGQLMSESGQVGPVYYTHKQFYRFIRPDGSRLRPAMRACCHSPSGRRRTGPSPWSSSTTARPMLR